jgi:hypothetical protein
MHRDDKVGLNIFSFFLRLGLDDKIRDIKLDIYIMN